MLYGYVTGDTFPLLVTYAVGDLLNIAFIAVYYRYTTQRAYVLKATSFAFLCNAIVTVYAVLGKRQVVHQSAHDLNQVVGFIAIASSLLLYASPFSAISNVVKTKSSASIPITMCLIGVVNNALWIIYGFLISDIVLIIPTCINVVLGCIQVVLFFVYHPNRRRQRGNAAVQSAAAIAKTSGEKHEVPFSFIVTPKEGIDDGGREGIASSAISVQSEIELVKITLASPQHQQMRSPIPIPPTPEK